MLTDTKVKALKPKDKPYKVSDARGLYIHIQANGSKYWRLKYRFAGKEKLLSIGTYPDVSLADAREEMLAAKRQLRKNLDPSIEKKKLNVNLENTFEGIAREWHSKQVNLWSEKHAKQVLKSLQDDIFPYLGSRPISEITSPDLLAVLRRIENRGALDILGRVRQRCDAVFKYAIATGNATYNPAADLVHALKSPKKRNYNSLKKEELPELLDALEKYPGDPITKLGLKLLLLTFVRTGELIGARWEEINWDEHMWTIPAERMKKKREHLVPLSIQTNSVLEELKPFTARYEHILASPRKSWQPISNNTLLYGLYRMGFHSRMTGHGFRTTASTTLNEVGFNPDAIERQLAHVPGNKVRGVYNKAEYLPERIKMMQAWADLLEDMSNKVVPIRKNLAE